jgi:5-methylcytosine-specific restriction endonuclease McrA
VRDAFIAKTEQICAQCGAADQLVVDHRVSRKRRPDLALTESNLQMLCWACNSRKANRLDEE